MITRPDLNWGMLSHAERSAAYDNSGAVPDSPTLIAARNAASVAFRATVPAATLDLPYGPGERTKWDLYPAAQPNAPCLVFIHGGYWQRNRREDFACLAEGMLAHGWSVAMPGYTLAPEATLTAIAMEMETALDWLAAEGPMHRISGPVLLCGWSAGGHLTALALPHPLVVAGLAISGVFELGPMRDTALNEALQISDHEIAALSPLRLPVTPKPLAIAYGTAELPALVEDSRALHRLRSAAHAPGPLIPVAGANHFTILEELRSPEGLLARAAIGLV